MTGGWSGPAIIAGDHQNSLLYQRIIQPMGTDGSMPPNDPLSQSQIDLIAQWIDEGAGNSLSTDELIEYWGVLIKKYPIVSIEDPFDEDDINGFAKFTNLYGKNLQIVGDDLFVTSEKRLSEGIQKEAGNSILIKPNQVGTLTETLDTISKAKKHNFNTIISHRSGETEDNFISDLCVGINAGQIKTGSLSRSDRTSKYNQLLRIEEQLGEEAKFIGNEILDIINKE